MPAALEFLENELGLAPATAEFLMRYLRAGAAALGAVPSFQTVIAERFFDEAGGMQLILHAPFGGRINRAWGLALRKRFCRTFNFELQAAASDDGILLSLGEQHSFPLADIFQFLSPDNVEEVLVQAVLQTPLFGTRFRWNATRALSMLRHSGGRRVPPQIQRARSTDLIAAVFPEQLACQDNTGPAEITPPDHPLVKETLDNCLHEAMDIDGLKAVLGGIRDGRIRTLAVDLPEPSVFAHQLLNSQPYTYLDDAPLEERRARAISVRRTLPPEDAGAFGALDPDAIAQVISDAQPVIRDAEELHDALLQQILLPAADLDPDKLASLSAERRAAQFNADGVQFVVAAERVAYAQVLFPGSRLEPPLDRLPGDPAVDRDEAAVALTRGWLEICGPTRAEELAGKLKLPEPEVSRALLRLESDGQVLRGQFRAIGQEGSSSGLEWCDRRLLQRIHRLTVGRLRREIEPLSPQDFMRFLFRWHHLERADALRGKGGLLKAVALLQGFEAPAAAWEQVLLPIRMHQYLPEALDKACWDGEVAWGRLTQREPKSSVPGPRRGWAASPPEAPSPKGRRPAPGRNASITFVRREELDWLLGASRTPTVPADLSKVAQQIAEVLGRRGALFFADLIPATRRLPSEVEDALWELLARGVVTSDAVDNLRVLQSPKMRRRQRALRRGGPGRWSLLHPSEPRPMNEVHEHIAWVFLQRYGIVWRDLVVREPLSPSWRELLYVYRRLEARGEIRGGRFLSGFAGEQFALPDAVEIARAVRRAPPTRHRIAISAVDPLNLTGLVTPGPRVPAVMGNVVHYVDGVPEETEVTEPDQLVSAATAS
jgi:ATP-dependent Lhr-like helicase